MLRYLGLVTLTGALAILPGTAQATSFTVTTTGDGSDSAPGNGVCAASGGGCTLRAAIQEANALAGADVINFSIGTGAQTISLGAALPNISQAVTIDGWTQPGFAGSPRIYVKGNNLNTTGLVIGGGGTTVRGLVIANFNGHGVELNGTGGHVLEGNYVGLGPDGTTPVGNTGHGVMVNSDNNRIGGTAIVQRNLIAKNTAKGNGGGIVLTNANGNTIQGNFIGTDITGNVEQPNEARGIAVIGSSNNMIGGPEPGAGNLISGNRATGVRLLGGSSNNTIQANIIGVNKAITERLPNDRGVQIRDGCDNNKVLGNLIGGNTYDGVLIWGGTNTLVQGNIIAGNGYGPVGDPQEQGWFGVWVATGTNNQVLSNRIISNYLAGINLGQNIVQDPNDAGDADSGANGMQNYPVLTSAVRGTSTTAVNGTLNSTPNTSFIVQFFANSTCDVTAGPSNGEGENFLGEITVNTNGAGDAGISVNVGALVPAGWVMTATATGPTGTSEFSACRVVQ
jgi:CSLREA domain-containing protein